MRSADGATAAKRDPSEISSDHYCVWLTQLHVDERVSALIVEQPVLVAYVYPPPTLEFIFKFLCDVSDLACRLILD